MTRSKARAVASDLFARIRQVWKRRATRRILKVVVMLLVLPWLLLIAMAAMTPLPPEFKSAESYDVSTVILDRHGSVLRELRSSDGTRARWIRVEQAGERIQLALFAAEDRRFQWHPGIDPVAMTRALAQLITQRRVVSGASTITQQLARTVVPRPRTVWGKVKEMALALRLEASLSKHDILEQYLNRVVFGPGLRGVEAASRFYFDKPTSDLSLAEACALASMPRGPTLYDPRRNPDLLKRRRDRVLDRMLDAGFASADDVTRAKEEPLVLAPKGSGLGAIHLVQAVLSGTVDTTAGPMKDRASAMTLTIDRGLQRELEVLAQQTVRGLASRKVGAASVIVIDNPTGEVLAYIGSHDADDTVNMGHNDGVIALRQPGSTLKPFLYELAMEQLHFTAATVLPDVALQFPTRDSMYAPKNYDGLFHGPVRLREALANSFNVPAVWTVDALLADRVLERLRALGLTTLDRESEYYGVAIALGDGEVRLVDLANAYATLARGGLYLPVKAVREARDRDNAVITLPKRPEPIRVMDAVRARIIIDILSDDKARLSSFGEDSVLNLPFAVAAKTGTSKGFRDNFAVGFTPDVTVAVWVGNFDGSPMNGVSGITGAGPLFQDAMMAASRVRPPRPFDPFDSDAVAKVEVCSLSGLLPTPHCPHHRVEVIPRDDVAQLSSCDMHEVVKIDKRNGLRAGAGCAEAFVEEKVFERYDGKLAEWARVAGRPTAPASWSPQCPAKAGDDRSSGQRLRIAFPLDEARFYLDPTVTSRQAIRLRAEVPSEARHVRLVLDGRTIPLTAPYTLDWPLVRGSHTLRVEADGFTPSEAIEFSVE